MFWKSKRQCDQEFLMSMLRATAEGQSRATINQALGSIGKQLPPEPDNTQYSINAACAVVTAVMEKAGKPPTKADSDDRFVGGIFLFVAGNHISRIVGAPFEMVSSAAVVIMFLDIRRAAEAGTFVNEIADAYNTLSQGNQQVVQAIGQNIAKWIEKPSDELFDVCRRHIVTK